MATQVQIQGNVQATQEARTLVSRVLDVNTTDQRINIHDGSTAGGIPHVNYRDAQNNEFTYATASGTNALTASLARIPTYTEGLSVKIKPVANNTGAVTINLNGLGAKNLQKDDGSGTLVALTADDIRTGIPFIADYNGTVFILRQGGGGGGAYLETQVFTSSGTWTKPAGCKYVEVTVVGGGGGSGGGGNGGNGGTSSFGSHCSATGGSGSNASTPIGANGGTGSGGDYNFQGSDGSAGAANSTSESQGGSGGNSFLGGGGSGGYTSTSIDISGNAGNSYGGGGGGAFIYNSGASRSVGGGGGGGCSIENILDASLGSTETITVGSGGAAGSGGGAAGAAGVVIVKAYG